MELNKLSIPYNVLQREVEGDRALYASVVNRMKETDVVRSVQQDNILIKAPALIPDKAVDSHRILVVGGTTLPAGLMEPDSFLAAVPWTGRCERWMKRSVSLI